MDCSRSFVFHFIVMLRACAWQFQGFVNVLKCLSTQCQCSYWLHATWRNSILALHRLTTLLIPTAICEFVAPCRLLCSNTPWFVCWFRRYAYINCLFVYLLNFLPHVFLPYFFFPYAFFLTYLLPYWFTSWLIQLLWYLVYLKGVVGENQTWLFLC